MNVKIVDKIPSDADIAALEKKADEMRAMRDAAKGQLLAALKSESTLSLLGRDELIWLLKKLQARIQGVHKKVRGSPVPDDLKRDLIAALRQDTYTLSQLEKTFGVSVSYISRIKKELKEVGQLKGPVMNAYEDRQMAHQQHKEEHHVVSA